MSMLRKSVTLSLQEEIDTLKKNNSFAISLSNPSFSPKYLKNINLSKFNLQGSLAGEEKLINLSKKKLFKNWNIINQDKSQILITNGAKAALYCIFKGISNDNKKNNFGIINPNWPTYVDLINVANANPFFFNTYLRDNFNIDLIKLEKFIIENNLKLLVVSSPNNPCGKVYDEKTILNLIKICTKNKCYLILDESFSSHIFIKQSKENIIKYNHNYLIIVNSFSKNFHLQGLRLGAILASKKMIEIFTNIHIAINGAPNYLAQNLIIKYRNELLKTPDLTKKMNFVSNFFTSKGVDFYKPDGSFYIFPKILNKRKFKDLSKKNGLFYLSGDAFGDNYKDYYRFCFEKNEMELRMIVSIMDKNGIY